MPVRSLVCVRRSVGVLVVAAYPGLRVGLLIGFVPALGCEIKVLISAVHHIQAAGVAGISVEYGAAAIAIEHADTGRFRFERLLPLIIVIALLAFELLRPEGDAVVIVEVGSERRHPLEGPAHALLVGV